MKPINTTFLFLLLFFSLSLAGCGGGSSSGGGAAASTSGSTGSTGLASDFSGTYRGSVTATVTSFTGESATATEAITIVITESGRVTITDTVGNFDSGTLTGSTFRVLSPSNTIVGGRTFCLENTITNGTISGSSITGTVGGKACIDNGLFSFDISGTISATKI